MDPNAKNQDLMYVTNSRSGDVTVLTYPAGSEAGVIAGFSEPEGECVDSTGDVFIADRFNHRTQEFAHAGTVPIQILDYPGAQPFGCSVDPVTGNLAVTNGARTKKAETVVAVYAGATGTPHTYALKGFNASWCGYDDRGNLYVDGVQVGHHHTFVLEELPKDGTALVPISIDQTINYAGSVQWDGKYMMIADLFPPVAYRFTLTQSAGTVVGKTTFGNLYEVAQFWLYRNKITGADNGVSLWNYPAGGNPIKTFAGDYPVAGVISPAQKRP